MRADQYERLQALTVKLTDHFLDEANPDNWPGAGISIAKMDSQTRGDSYWCRKVAAGTLSLIMRITNLTGKIQEDSADKGAGGAAIEDDEQDMDREVASAERKAAQLLDRMQSEARKTAFDKKTHGKA
jgi:hypothetical protein